MVLASTADRSGVLRVPAGDDGLLAAVSDAGVRVAGVGPTGVEAHAPLVTATADGRTAFYPGCGPGDARAVANRLAEGSLEDSRATCVVEHDPDAGSLPAAPLRGLDVGERRLLGGAGWRRPTAPDDHADAGGFVDADPPEIVDAAGELLGRGWGDWRHDEPVADDWNRSAPDRASVVVVNAHGTVADALLCESVPLEVLEGADLVARATGADRAVVYVSADDGVAEERLRGAVEAYPDPAVGIDVVAGPAAYRAGEPTMALEAIEGNHRLEARLRAPDRPLPTLAGTPALVHTARTVAQLALAVRTGELPRTRLVTVAGDVDAPATVEPEEGAPLDAALAAVEPDDGVKAACVGGRFGGLTADLDVAIAPEALLESDLGTEGTIEVLGEGRCLLAFAGRRTRVAAETNCGRCVPCREGSTQLAELLRDVYDGDYEPASITELTRTMADTSVCGFGVAASRPARTAIAEFGPEVEAHARDRCPAGDCFDTVEVSR